MAGSRSYMPKFLTIGLSCTATFSDNPVDNPAILNMDKETKNKLMNLVLYALHCTELVGYTLQYLRESTVQ